MSRAYDHLRREVLRRAAERVRLLAILLHDLSKTKVSKHDVAIVIQKDILWLQITIDDVAFVEIPEGECYLCRVKFCLFFRKALLLGEVLKELAALNELHDEVDSVSFLEDVVHPDNERVIDLVKDQLFDLERLYGLMLNHYILPDALHGVILAISTIFDQVDFSESASPDNTDELEVIERHLSHSGSSIKQTRAGGATPVGLICWNFSVKWSLLRLSLC